MERKAERRIWIVAVTILLITTLFLGTVQVISAQNNDIERDSEDFLRLFQAAYYFLLNNYVDELDPETLFEGAMTGLFESLDDPYSIYLDDYAFQSLNDTTNGEFGGVGIYIARDWFSEDEKENGKLPYVHVVSPIEGTPAYKAGIHAGDYIYRIEGESAEGLNTDEISDLLRGKPGTSVNVTILRNKRFEIDFELTRAVIEIPTVKFDMIGNIGYMRIIQFTPFTADRVKDALEYFENNHYESLIIDLRNNGGGLLTSVVEICDFFFNEGTIVSTISRIPNENRIYRASEGTLVDEDLPIFTLIDGGSASASEILTGALKDRGRGVVLGQTSYGKGSVQQMIALGKSAMKFTISRYYTPSGISIDKTGITPDIEVEEILLTDDEMEYYRKILENNLIGLFIEKNPEADDATITEFIEELKAEEIYLEEAYLRYLIRVEQQRKMDNPPVYDLEFDETLKRALEQANL